MGNTWKSLYELTQLTSNVWHYLLVIQLLESPTYKVRFPFVVINRCSHYWCQHPAAQQVTPVEFPFWGDELLLFMFVLQLQCPLNATYLLQFDHLGGNKWIKSNDCILNSPWKIGGFFFNVFNKGNIFYLLASYYLN